MTTLSRQLHPPMGLPPADRRRVAMFVMNPCHADARVRREAQALTDRGYRVRIFALAGGDHPAGVFLEDEGFEIQRLAVHSFPQDLYRFTSRVLQWAYRAARKVGSKTKRAAVVAHARARAVGGDARVRGGRFLRRLERMPLFVPLRPAARWLRGHLEGATRPALSLERKRNPLLSVAAGVGWVVLVAVRMLRAGVVHLYGGLRRALRGLHLALRVFRRVGRRVFLVIREVVFKFHRPSIFRRFWRISSRAALAWNPDIVHAHDLNVLPGAVRAAAGGPVVYDSHELWRHRNRGGQWRPAGRLADMYIERRYIRRAALVITVSQGIGDWLQRRYNLKNPPLILRNVPVGDRYAAVAPSLRDLCHADEGQRVLVYTGGITTSRGLEETIDVLEKLPDDLLFVLLGYGRPDYIEELMTRARARGVRHRVRKVPAVLPELVPAVASQADLALVYIQPTCLSYYYCLPNKLFEALQAGLPVVATDLPEMRAVLQRYGAGELCKVGNAEDLAAAVHRVLGSPERYRRGALQAASDLRWELEKERLLGAYDHLLPDAPSATIPSVDPAAVAIR